jgi:hypothetical protein
VERPGGRAGHLRSSCDRPAAENPYFAGGSAAMNRKPLALKFSIDRREAERQLPAFSALAV